MLWFLVVSDCVGYEEAFRTNRVSQIHEEFVDPL